MGWSTVSDGPTTDGMQLADFLAYYKEEYGAAGLRDVVERIERADKHGTSAVDGSTLADLVSVNHAGPRGGRLTLKVQQSEEA